ncbi:phosphatase PAP2 family protein [Kocuria sp.]|uniref:phosphatase PAP2 family protein n=1 Tax=Kocuria sp. TaxID=1871328 RepID=UPI0026DFF51A|nr:phosphatase PAP2 family protein [Kocuria sp.]MDO5617475.1 phosphatase PAP2 family protein [Kocuria sp.]
MPSVSGSGAGQRYELSADPATAPIQTTYLDRSADAGAPPWQEPAPTQPAASVPPAAYTRQQQPSQQAQYGGSAASQGQGNYGQYGQPAPAGQAAPSGYQAGPHATQQPHPPAAYGATAHPSAAHTPARDLSFGIVMGLLLRAVILLAAAGALAYYALRTIGGQWSDELALQEGQRLLTQLPSAVLPWVDLVPVAVCVLWGVVALLFAVGSNRWVPLLVGMLSGLGAVVSVQLLKREFLVKAPFGIQETTMNSLPSGHTAAAATAAMIAVMVAPARWRGSIAFFGALTTALAGFSTVLNGWHRPMDTMVSVLVVAFWGVVGALLLRCLIRPERFSANLSITTLVFAILLILAAAGGLAALQTTTISGLPLATGAAGILGFSLLAAHQTVRALRPRRRAP